MPTLITCSGGMAGVLAREAVPFAAPAQQLELCRLRAHFTMWGAVGSHVDVKFGLIGVYTIVRLEG